MNRNLRLLAVLSLIAFLAPEPAEGGPFSDFFRKVRRTFSQSDQKSRSHKTTTRQSNETPPKDSATEGGGNSSVTTPPSGKNTRAATAASMKKGAQTDLPYGTPVPGKKGFVTSPFAPESGYVDVREFPPGSEVKDPYTGKIFRTP